MNTIINPKKSYIQEIDNKIIEQYGIREEEGKISFDVPIYISITKKENFSISKTENVYEFINDCCHISIWINCFHMHVTTF